MTLSCVGITSSKEKQISKCCKFKKACIRICSYKHKYRTFYE